MKSALEKCTLALNSNPTTPTAGMVKIEDGFMSGYGGTFCIKTPVSMDIGCCFTPSHIKNFFRKERKQVAYTIKNKRLVLSEGKERLTLPCLPPEELVTLDVFEPVTVTDMLLDDLKHVVSIVDAQNARMWAQGVMFRYGCMESTNNAVFISALSDLPEDLEFNLPVETCKALLKMKSKVISIAKSNNAVKFNFEGGTSVTSLAICEPFPDIAFLFRGPWNDIKVSRDVLDDLLTVDCERILIDGGNIEYNSTGAFGTLEGVIAPATLTVALSKTHFDIMAKLGGTLQIADDSKRVQASSATCRAISSTMA